MGRCDGDRKDNRVREPSPVLENHSRVRNVSGTSSEEERLGDLGQEVKVSERGSLGVLLHGDGLPDERLRETETGVIQLVELSTLFAYNPLYFCKIASAFISDVRFII